MALVRNIGLPANESERRVLAFLRDKLPDHYIVYANIEQVNDRGLPYEYDCIVLAPNCVFVIEMKDYHGIIAGNAADWVLGGGTIKKSPFPLLNNKTKVVAERLRNYSALLANVYVHSFILIEDPHTKINVNDPQSDRIIHLDNVSEYINQYVNGIGRRNLSSVEHKFIDEAISAQYRPMKKDRKIGDYSIIESVNKNKLYTTYLAKHDLIPFPERFFLKVYDLDLYATPERRKKQKEQILHEAVVLNSLKENENIVKVFPPFPWEDDQIVLPYEWINARTLRSVLFDIKGSIIESKLDIALQIAKGLKFLHDNKVVHRDIRPENIMVQEKGPIKIVNFDCAKWEIGPMPTIATFAGRHVDQRYTAPEVWENAHLASDKSDIYSFGIVLFEIITGSPPYSHIKDHLQKGELPSLSDYKQTSELLDLGSLIKSMCAIDPEKRSVSAQSLIELLEIIKVESYS